MLETVIFPLMGSIRLAATSNKPQAVCRYQYAGWRRSEQGAQAFQARFNSVPLLKCNSSSCLNRETTTTTQPSMVEEEPRSLLYEQLFLFLATSPPPPPPTTTMTTKILSSFHSLFSKDALLQSHLIRKILQSAVQSKRIRIYYYYYQSSQPTITNVAHTTTQHKTCPSFFFVTHPTPSQKKEVS